LMRIVFTSDIPCFQIQKYEFPALLT